MRICRRCKEPYMKWLSPVNCPQCKSGSMYIQVNKEVESYGYGTI